MTRKGVPFEDLLGYIPSLVKKNEKYLRGAISLASGYFVWDMKGFNSFSCSLWNNVENPTVIFEQSNDGQYWSELQVFSAQPFVSNVSRAFKLPNNKPTTYKANKVARFVRVSIANGTSFTLLGITLSDSRVEENINEKYLQDNVINYVSVSAITSTTPVTIATGLSPSFINTIASMQLVNSGIAGTELLIKSSSTVIYRTYINANSSDNIVFAQALKGLAGQALTVELVTATDVSLYFNSQGFILTASI